MPGKRCPKHEVVWVRTCDASACGNCRKFLPSGSLKICVECSNKLNQCQYCRGTPTDSAKSNEDVMDTAQ